MRWWTRQWWSVAGDAWRTQLWPVPSIGVLIAVGLGVGLPRVDAAVDDALPASVTGYLFSGGPEAARTVLSSVAGSLITVTALTFSLTVVTLQLASSQFSPRLLRTFTRDRLVHVTLAVLLATFTYALTVLRTVRASLDSHAAFVPQLSVTVAYLLALGSVITLVAFLAHLARQIRVESMLREVHTDTSATLRRVLPETAPGEADQDPPVVPAVTVPLCGRTSGFFTSTDETGLLDAAVTADVVLLVDRLPGDSLIAGTPIAVAWRAAGTPITGHDLDTLSGQVADAIRTGFERTAAQDPGFGLRQLVDVAVKALSPGINDPTTAIHALGHAAAVLCEAAGRDLGPRLLRDDSGTVRVILRRPNLAELLDLVVAAPRRYGAADPDVLARLLNLLRELAWTIRHPTQHRTITEQLDRLNTTIGRQDFDPAERAHLTGLARHVEQAMYRRWPPHRSD
jgi:uncharacterized membrane protein